jgi:hypothetical protein
VVDCKTHHGAEGAKLDEHLAELIAQKEALLGRQG